MRAVGAALRDVWRGIGAGLRWPGWTDPALTIPVTVAIVLTALCR